MDFGLKEQTITRIRAVFAGIPEIEQVIIYGSRAMGTCRTGSDIDLTIRGLDVSLSQLLKLENDLDDLLLPYRIDLSLLHRIEDPELLDHIERVGRVFYEK